MDFYTYILQDHMARVNFNGELIIIIMMLKVLYYPKMETLVINSNSMLITNRQGSKFTYQMGKMYKIKKMTLTQALI